MKKHLIKTLCIFTGILISYAASAQKATIAINNGSKTVQVNPSGLKHISIRGKGHDNKEHTYTGVLLSDVLAKGGRVLGTPVKKDNASRYILVKAKDNYKSVYAMAEIDPLYTTKTIIVADKVDGKALTPEDGPFQIIVPGEKIHARWIRQIVSISLMNTK